jgi:hypothetical protein
MARDPEKGQKVTRQPGRSPLPLPPPPPPKKES